MKRAVMVLALALAGCGGQSECSKLTSQADAWARAYVAPFSQSVTRASVRALAASELKVLALQHGVSCS